MNNIEIHNDMSYIEKLNSYMSHIDYYTLHHYAREDKLIIKDRRILNPEFRDHSRKGYRAISKKLLFDCIDKTLSDKIVTQKFVYDRIKINPISSYNIHTNNISRTQTYLDLILLGQANFGGRFEIFPYPKSCLSLDDVGKKIQNVIVWNITYFPIMTNEQSNIFKEYILKKEDIISATTIRINFANFSVFYTTTIF